jgi:HK97 family phage major capsid protein
VTTTALPTTPAEFEDYVQGLDSQEKFGKAFTDGTFGKAVKAYAEAYHGEQNKTMAELQKMVTEETQAAVTELLKSNGYTADGARLPLAGKVKHSKKAPGAGLDGRFSDLGEFIQTAWHGRTRASMSNAKELAAHAEFLAAYQEKVPSDGGFLVPEEFRTEIITKALETSLVRPGAMVIPMATPTLTMPTVDATSNVSSVFGGIVFYRTEEGEEFVESQAKFARIKLDATKLTGLAHITNETIKDTRGALTAWLMANLPRAYSWFEDLDFINGSGAGEPLGILNAANPALIVVEAENGQLADTLVWENILSMYTRMLPGSLATAEWWASPDTFKELATMALSVGTGGSAVWLVDGRGRPQLTLLGLPVRMTEKAPGVLGDQSDLSLVDASEYMIGDREEMSIETSPHVKFTSDQTTLRVIGRNDGRPAVLSAINPQNGGPTLSPFVTLGERA